MGGRRGLSRCSLGRLGTGSRVGGSGVCGGLLLGGGGFGFGLVGGVVRLVGVRMEGLAGVVVFRCVSVSRCCCCCLLAQRVGGGRQLLLPLLDVVDEVSPSSGARLWS